MKLLNKFIIISIAILSLSQFFVACDHSTAAGPDTIQITQNNVKILQLGNKGFNKLFSQSQWIGEDGGTITVGDAESGYSWINFPEGYLQNDNASNLGNTNGAYIQFFWQSEGLLAADFYPHGLQFAKPVYVRLSYKDANLTDVNEANLGIYYFNEVTEQYERVKSESNVSGQYVHGYLYHFSRYAIGTE